MSVKEADSWDELDLEDVTPSEEEKKLMASGCGGSGSCSCGCAWL